MSRIRTVIVDDEPVARAGIRKLLLRDESIEIVGEAGDGEAAVRVIEDLEPDLLLLDVQMPELNGFEVLQRIGPDAVPVVIFVTAYDHFALRAFEVQALDYILKPFDDERFAAVIERAKVQLGLAREGALARRLESLLTLYEQRTVGEGMAAEPYLTRIMVKNAGIIFFQPVETIDWIEAADYYAKLHVGDAVHLVKQSMNELEQRLDPAAFVRVHRSAIVNLARIRELRPDYQNHHIIVLKSGTRVPLSRSRRDDLEKRLAGQ